MTHTGKFLGKCDAQHGMSRRRQSNIQTESGGMIFTHENVDLPKETLVTFEHAISLSCEQVAVNVKAKDALNEIADDEPPRKAEGGLERAA